MTTAKQKGAPTGKRDIDKIFFFLSALCDKARLTRAYAEADGVRYYYNAKGDKKKISVKTSDGHWVDIREGAE